MYIASANTKYTTNGAAYEESDPSFVPSYDSFSGDNYFDRNTQILHLVSGQFVLQYTKFWECGYMVYHVLWGL